ncbi:MAG TPA: translesion error-prone DNA polymerase V autoproteolytic subunit [Tenuifilaceae bacterium]|mgnify:CR=1 FL=1|nr:translesion error-prone DNA polymerase V autoproteolytic subunit [Tenuifilaceae bacterium]HPE19681.1 translesion error-prone DNA polymerase V autoproteolytic subunit [Tenuifilaceae bacterium]HPJ46957.1 translesion error-prone DNA polymerase V autoproteolytic subunit [Tenuifilaceae bacterium]HPQ35161.1 translesion error-prone DNA polymerase V autoproteolytic subunit [Tenuifilaceae bacterium]HRX67266.1 translesion error-prone DNA polymerase V autoproteolytic subunit [Tenuifilaceae bacterium]
MQQGKEKNVSLKFFVPEVSEELELPLVDAYINAGFPSPADDYLEGKLDLNSLLIRNPSSTFFARVRGSSMKNAGIHDGDILIIDKSLTPSHNSVLVCFIDGEFTVKKIQKKNGEFYLMPENPDFAPIKIDRESDFRLWGVVTYCIHKL